LKISGTTLVLLGGQKSILSMDAVSAYEENKIVVIELNRNGEATNIKTFKRKNYDGELRAQIVDKLCLTDQMKSGGIADLEQKRKELQRLAKITSNSL
jgi:hypothetical protein